MPTCNCMRMYVCMCNSMPVVQENELHEAILSSIDYAKAIGAH